VSRGDATLLPIDSDVLIQIFKAGSPALHAIRALRAYNLQAAIVEDVEQELAWHAKFRDRFDAPTQKAIANGHLVRLDESTIQRQIQSAATPVAGVATAGAYNTIGKEYARRVGAGEAYTFAAALALNTPAASNDFSAIKTLSGHGQQLPSPVLRFLDLVVFALQAGELTGKDCDDIRKNLVSDGEYLTPRNFQRASFEDALKQFEPRLVDAGRPRLGRRTSAAKSAYQLELIVQRP
jgi:hypothetical protein